jgi:flagellar hook protein FlgE
MDFGIAISGLNASSTSIDTIGNNISNASTVGFKTAITEFAAQYLPPIGGGSAQSGGAGVKVTTVAQQFTQGSISSTGNNLDVAIDGSGFFQLDNNGATQYTRNGQFHVDAFGYLVSSNGARVQGYASNSNGGVVTGTVGDLLIPQSEIAPTTTTTIKGNLNLDSRSTPIPSTTTFSTQDQTSFNNESSVTVYDTLGNPHTLTNYFALATVNPSGGSTWNVYSTVDGAAVTSTQPDTLAFSANGVLQGANGSTTSNVVSLTAPQINGSTTPLSMNYDFSGTTQFGSAFAVTSLSQDGGGPGILTGFSFAPNGVITGTYSNGKTGSLGQVTLTNFANPQGLERNGDNTWTATATSGTPIAAAPPGSNGTGSVQGSSLESSNVDLTSQLVHLITAQRDYQANAQTVKTLDSMFNTINTLR